MTTDQIILLTHVLAGDPLPDAEAPRVYDMLRTIQGALPHLLTAWGARLPPRPPDFVCERCGATGKFYGGFTRARFEDQHDRFRRQHTDCPLAIDGGGI